MQRTFTIKLILMQRTEKINEINKRLPYGAKKHIAEKTGLSQKTIINFFKARSVSVKTSQKIIKEVKIIVNIDKSLKDV